MASICPRAHSRTYGSGEESSEVCFCDSGHKVAKPELKGLKWEPQSREPKNIVGIEKEHTGSLLWGGAVAPHTRGREVW